jgi:hypothetical protein
MCACTERWRCKDYTVSANAKAPITQCDGICWSYEWVVRMAVVHEDEIVAKAVVLRELNA